MSKTRWKSSEEKLEEWEQTHCLRQLKLLSEWVLRQGIVAAIAVMLETSSFAKLSSGQTRQKRRGQGVLKKNYEADTPFPISLSHAFSRRLSDHH